MLGQIEGLPERRNVKLAEEYGEKLWSRMIGYGDRWMVETIKPQSKSFTDGSPPAIFKPEILNAIEE